MDASERKEKVRQWVADNPQATKKECQAWMYETWPSITGGGHRGMLNRMYPNGESPWDADGNPIEPQVDDETLTARCPKCAKEARGHDEITERFGWRYAGKTPQSWCKECR